MEIFIVSLKTCTDDLFSKMLTSVSNIRKQRTLRYRKQHDRLHSLISELLSVYMFTKNCPRHLKLIEFKKNKYGKPYIANCPDFHFNISHSENWVVGCYDTKPIGIDVEYIQNNIDHLDLAYKIFHPSELKAYLSTPIELRVSRFFEIWTLKESVIKAVGTGLSLPLTTFCTVEQYSLINIPKFATYKLATSSELKGYKLSICSHKTNEYYIKEININDLLKTVEDLHSFNAE
jgi:4'-phosphopantetheinyl transferase